MVQALAHVVLEKKRKKKSSLSKAEDVFRFQWFFTQYGKVARFTQRKAIFSIRSLSHHSRLLHKFKITGVVVLNSDSKKKSPVC